MYDDDERHGCRSSTEPFLASFSAAELRNWLHGGHIVAKLLLFHLLRIGCFPANRCYFAPHGGFVRLIRPLSVVRVFALLLGISVCLPITADAAQKSRRKTTAKSSATARRSTPRAAARPAYSAAASNARKARLARARSAARAREVARMRSLQEAMTPRYKTDANGELVPDIRAAAAIIFNPANGQVLWE